MAAIRLVLAIWFGKIASILSHIRGKGGSSLPGMVARAIYPGVLTDLSCRLRKPRLMYLEGQGYKKVPGRIVAVTGTNGKTTVTNILSDFLKVAGQRMVYNREGANMINGVTTAFLAQVGFFGKITCEFALLEIDEGSLPEVMEEVGLDILVVTNFSSDQEDRYRGSGGSADIVKKALAKDADVWLVLNADDPRAVGLADAVGQQAFFYGMVTGERNLEHFLCPRCSKKLVVGMEGCPGKYVCNCGFVRPEPDLTIVKAVRPSMEGLCCQVHWAAGKEYTLRMATQGFYNYYNMAAAFLTGMCLGLQPDRMIYGFQKYQPSPGRMEWFSFRNKPVVLNLVKNARGYSETLPLLEQMSGRIDVLLCLGDAPADGRDVSWIWDVDFELLSYDEDKYVAFICTGPRGAEMAVRLKYAGAAGTTIRVVDDMHMAVQSVLESPGEHTVMLSSYSTLMPVRTILMSMASTGQPGQKSKSQPRGVGESQILENTRITKNAQSNEITRLTKNTQSNEITRLTKNTQLNEITQLTKKIQLAEHSQLVENSKLVEGPRLVETPKLVKTSRHVEQSQHVEKLRLVKKSQLPGGE